MRANRKDTYRSPACHESTDSNQRCSQNIQLINQQLLLRDSIDPELEKQFELTSKFIGPGQEGDYLGRKIRWARTSTLISWPWNGTCCIRQYSMLQEAQRTRGTLAEKKS